MTARTTEPNPSRGRSLLLPAIALILGLAAGAYWHAPLLRLIGRAGNAAGPAHADSAAAAKQLWTCSMHPQVMQEQPGLCPICHMELTPLKSGGSSASAPGAVTIEPAVVQNMGVRTTTATTGPLTRSVRAAGVLRETQSRVYEVNLRVSGWIERLYADTEGMLVKKGDALFELYSPELQVTIEELIAARRGVAALGGDTGKTPVPGEPLPPRPTPSGSMTNRPMPSTYQALLDASRRRLSLIGLDDHQIDTLASMDKAPATIVIKSPMTGEVAEKAVVTGSAVESGQRAMRIIDRSALWLDAQVFEQHLPNVRIGQKAKVSVSSMPGEDVEGSVVFIAPRVDEQSRTAVVRIELPNKSLALRPGQYATVSFELPVAQAAVLVPRSAVMDTGERQVVFIDKGGGTFEPHGVAVGPSGDGGMVAILKGISAGDRVVTSGQFLLDTESRLREAIEKFRTQGGGAAAASTAGAADATADPHAKIPDPPTDGPIAVDAAVQPAIDTMLSAYLAMAKVLGAKQTDATPVDPSVLASAATSLRDRAKGSPIEPLAAAVAAHAALLKGKGIDEQRTLFKDVSEPAIRLAELAPPSASTIPELFVVHCPMAPGTWLQTDEGVANPYYATQMKACGEVVRKVQRRAEPGGAPGSDMHDHAEKGSHP